RAGRSGGRGRVVPRVPDARSLLRTARVRAGHRRERRRIGEPMMRTATTTLGLMGAGIFACWWTGAAAVRSDGTADAGVASAPSHQRAAHTDDGASALAVAPDNPAAGVAASAALPPNARTRRWLPDNVAGPR